VAVRKQSSSWVFIAATPLHSDCAVKNFFGFGLAVEVCVSANNVFTHTSVGIVCKVIQPIHVTLVTGLLGAAVSHVIHAAQHALNCVVFGKVGKNCGC
jgi:hypothetical protein